MRTACWLGARLVTGRAERRRNVMALAGYAAAAAALGFSQSAARLLGEMAACRGDAGCEVQQQLNALLLFGTPAVIFAAAVARLSSVRRDRHLASLRVLGVGAGVLRGAVLLETTLLAAAGAAAGITVLHLVVPLVPGPLGRYAAPTLLSDLAAVVLLLAVAAGPTAVRSRRWATAPVQARASGRDAPPRTRRAVPLLVGLALVALVVAVPMPDAELAPLASAAWTLAWGIGMVGSVTGIAVALPLLTHRAGRLLGRRGPQPFVRLAGRGLEAQSTAVTRLSTTFVTTTTLASMLLIVVGWLMSSAEIATAVAANTTGPNYVLLTATPEQMAQVQSDPRVLRAAPLLQAECVAATDEFCGSALVATCAELRFLSAVEVDGCRDDVVSRLEVHVRGEPLRAAPTLPAGERLRLTYDLPVPGSFTAPHPGADLTVEVPQVSALGEFVPDLLVPPELASPVPDRGVRLYAELPPGLDHHRALARSYPGLDVAGAKNTGPDTYQAAVRTRLVLNLAVALAAALALAGLLWGVADDGYRRRRTATSLTRLGVPLGVIRRAAVLQYVVPLVVGAPLGALLGVPLFAAFVGDLSSPEMFGATPLQTAAQVATVGLAGALVVAVVAAVTTRPERD